MTDKEHLAAIIELVKTILADLEDLKNREGFASDD